VILAIILPPVGVFLRYGLAVSDWLLSPLSLASSSPFSTNLIWCAVLESCVYLILVTVCGCIRWSSGSVSCSPFSGTFLGSSTQCTCWWRKLGGSERPSKRTWCSLWVKRAWVHLYVLNIVFFFFRNSVLWIVWCQECSSGGLFLAKGIHGLQYIYDLKFEVLDAWKWKVLPKKSSVRGRQVNSGYAADLSRKMKA
jgi:hypothetical protein